MERRYLTRGNIYHDNDQRPIESHRLQTIASHKGDIKKLADDIWAEPELGYKEIKTAKKVEAAFSALGVNYRN